MFALWEWKCSIPGELLALAGVRGGRTADTGTGESGDYIELGGAVTTQNVLLVTGEND